MKTKKQEELINSYLLLMDKDTAAIYYDIILYLSQLGYHPKKQRSNIVFNHDLHGKTMAKTGFIRGKNPEPFFAIRFSACRRYSEKFDDIVRDAVLKPGRREALCFAGECNYCAGEPKTHVYTYISQEGNTDFHCGSVALAIPNITEEDVDEIKKLLKEEHLYLMKNQVELQEE